MTNKYDTIEVLKGIDGIRQNCSMYVGDVETGQALYVIFREILDNSIDEFMNGHGKKITVSIHKENSISVLDEGRGIPVVWNEKEKKNSLELAMCEIHAGNKFKNKDKESGYMYSGGLHGCGAAATNSLSERFKVVVWREGKEYSMIFEKGKKVQNLQEKSAKGHKTGTFIRFAPDVTIFKNVTTFDPDIIRERLRELSFLCEGLTIEFINEKNNTKEVFPSEDNLINFVKYLAKSNLISEPILIGGEKDGIKVFSSFEWLDNTTDEEISKFYTNNVPNVDGGSHAIGFKSAITRTINNYIEQADLPKTFKMNLSGDSVREGLISVVSILHPAPHYNSQTKTKLVSEDARIIVENIVSQQLLSYLEQNPIIAKKIIARCVNSQKAAEAAKKAREAIRKTAIDCGCGTLPGKLADCQEKDPDKCELFIVEGDSAGGCFFSNTLISLPNGLDISFADLVKDYENGKEHYCYTIKNNKVCIAKITNPRKTGYKKVIKLILDNGSEIVCTPDHKLMTKDNEFIEAKNSIGISLKSLSRKLSGWKKGQIKGYEMFWSDYDNKWKYTHIMSDMYNIENRKYIVKIGENCRHHIDFNKLNNYPDNITRMSKQDHFELHRQTLEHILHRPDVKEKSKLAKQTPEYREKISKLMSEPGMAQILSERAKKQWEDENYKSFMVVKWKDFYNKNEEYRNKTLEILDKSQKEYWSVEENKKKQSIKTKQYFEEHPEAADNNRNKAIEEWSNKDLLEWRKEETKKQWTDDFRANRKKAYNETYYKHTIKFLRELFDETGSLDEYDQRRISSKNKNLLKMSTFVNRFFNGDEELMLDAINNYNHKVVKIVELEEKMDVYDLEVPETHNFALAAGIFVHNSAKQGRDRRFQAILPLRGKIMNVEKSDFQKLIKSEEIMNLVTVIGAGVGRSFDCNDIRYGKIIIMTDADVDGAHIRTLLLTFFFRQMPQLILNGHVYIARPPLYRINLRGTVYYLQDDAAKEAFMIEKKLSKDSESGKKFQRFKGLGEMNPSQLWETAMDPDTRSMSKVMITDPLEADKVFSILMGEQVEPRKDFIINSSKFANIDV